MESKSSTKTITTTVMNLTGTASSTVIKKTIKYEIVTNGKTTQTTTVEEISGDNVDKLLAKFDQLSSDKQGETVEIDENTILKTIEKIDSQKIEDEIELDSIKIDAKDDQVNDNTIESEKINENKLSMQEDKENKLVDKQIVKPVESINQVNQQLTDKSDAKSTDRQKFNQQCLDKHNYYRSLHGVGPLTVNETLNELAQDWANHLASIGTLSHRPKNNFGENVFWISTKNIDGNRPVDSWYDEITKYNWEKATFSSGTGHFTQVVWKGSKQLGIGKSSSSKGTFVVCNYDPPGNFIGKFKESVLPLVKK